MSDPRQYTVGWICALETEYVASRSFLETKHDRPETLSPNDNNHYTLGEIGGHNVVIAVLPDGEYGTSSAAGVARDMVHSFPNIRFGLMVGIGGGVPTKHDIRLGDIVVSAARSGRGGRGGLIQYDLGKEVQGQEFRQTGFLNQPPRILRTAVSGLQAQYEEEGHQLAESVQAVLERNKRLRRKYARPVCETDQLYERQFAHPNLDASCNECCDSSSLVHRAERGEEEDDPAIYYGLRASGNRVIKDAISRDRLAAKEDILCFDMEGAGLMNHFPCLIIRGICDYADSHKSKEWQGYAAMVAAAYAKDLLHQIVPQRVYGERKAIEVLRGLEDCLNNVSRNIDSIHTITNGSAKKIEHMAQNIDVKELPIVDGAEFGTYMDQHEEECLHGTRTDLLHTIEEWAVLPDGKCMFWLKGLAGTGKSTISRTVAKTFQKQGLLAASFFFKRGEGDRGNATRFFPTIARQLFSAIPELRGDILQVIQKNPGIAAKPLKEQYEQLIRQPLDAFYQLNLRSSPLLIVIDALDECENENDIRVILQQLPRTRTFHSSYLRFFITSRPELPIRLGFQKVRNSYQDFILHEVPAPVVEHDIALFLEHKLAKIRTQRDLSVEWPGNEDFQTLLSMSIPLFNFAATICRLFDDYNLDPEQCLAEILQYQNEESKLGRTYLPVLKRLVSRYDGIKQTQIVQDVHEVLGTIILLESPLSVVSLSKLMGLPISSVRARLSSLHSVLDIPDNEVLPVRIYHLSFRDFLLDPNTRKQTPLWVDEKQINLRLTNYCLCIMEAKLKTNICNLPGYGTGRDDISGRAISQHLLPELQYACRYWIHHIARSKDILIQIDDILALLEVHFLHWVEVMSILGIVSEVIGGIATLKSLLPEDKGVRLSEFLDDAKRFILKNHQIADTAPLQIYMSGLLFAPKKSIVREVFEGEIPSWIHQWPRSDESWSSVLQILESNSHGVKSLAFSPDSQLLASGTAYRDINLWETSTGAIKYTLTSHSDGIESLAFSPDGRLLASCSGNSIELWDPATGTLKYTITDSQKMDFLLPQHSDIGTSMFTRQASTHILSVAFSLDGGILASSAHNGAVKLWDLTRGALKHTLQDHSPPVLEDNNYKTQTSGYSVAFSADGQLLACTSGNKIKFWDLATGALRHNLEIVSDRPFAGEFYSVAFSPDGRRLASGHTIRGVQLWYPTRGAPYYTLGGATSDPIAFSPDGKFLASMGDYTVQLWDSITGEPKQTLTGHSEGIYSLVFSPNGKLIASGSRKKGTITLWDPTTIAVSKHTKDSDPGIVLSLAFAPDGRLLASCSIDQAVMLWDSTTGQLMRPLKGPEDDWNGPDYCIFSPGSELLAVSYRDYTIGLWDPATGILKSTLVGPLADRRPELLAVSMAFSPNGQVLATGCMHHVVDVWDLATATHKYTLEDHTYSVESVAISPNGQLLASGDRNNVKIWDLATGVLRYRLLEPLIDGSLAFSPDGQLLAIGSTSELQLWDPVTGAHKRSIQSDASLREPGDDEEVFKHFSRNFSRLMTQLPSFSPRDWHDMLLSGFTKPINKPSLQDGQWITFRGERELRLPPDYRPCCSAVKDGAIALGCEDGRIHVIMFSV